MAKFPENQSQPPRVECGPRNILRGARRLLTNAFLKKNRLKGSDKEPISSNSNPSPIEPPTFRANLQVTRSSLDPTGRQEQTTIKLEVEYRDRDKGEALDIAVARILGISLDALKQQISEGDVYPVEHPLHEVAKLLQGHYPNEEIRRKLEGRTIPEEK